MNRLTLAALLLIVGSAFAFAAAEPEADPVDTDDGSDWYSVVRYATESEANDSAGTANRVPTPILITGSLVDADVDYFAVSGSSVEDLLFEITTHPVANGTDVDTLIEVFDASGNPGVTNSDSGQGLYSHVETTFTQSAIYYIKISAETGLGDYRLFIGNATRTVSAPGSGGALLTLD